MHSARCEAFNCVARIEAGFVGKFVNSLDCIVVRFLFIVHCVECFFAFIGDKLPGSCSWKVLREGLIRSLEGVKISGIHVFRLR